MTQVAGKQVLAGYTPVNYTASTPDLPGNLAGIDAVLPGAARTITAKAATTANITLSAQQTIDGVSLVAGDVCFVKNQTTLAQNGIYVVQLGSWTRSPLASTDAQLRGQLVSVYAGTAAGNTLWLNTNTSAITVGTTSITYASAGIATAAGSAVNGAAAAIGTSPRQAAQDHTHQVTGGSFGGTALTFSTPTDGQLLTRSGTTVAGISPAAFAARCASTANVAALTGLLTIDGITTVAGDIVLLKNQTTATQNGLYTAAAGAWSRTPAASADVGIRGMLVAVQAGTTNAGTLWLNTNTSAITLNTTNITYAQPKDLPGVPPIGQETLPVSLATTASNVFVSGTGTAWLAAVITAQPMTITQMRAYCLSVGSGGNLQLGIYDAGGNLLASSGTSALAAGVNTRALGSAITLAAGTFYYFAIWSNASSATFPAITTGLGATFGVQISNVAALPAADTLTNQQATRFWVQAAP